MGAIADRISSRSAVLMLTKGLIAPQGQLPSDYVSERVRARGIACLGGPAHAREAVSGSAALVLGSADEELRVQIGEVFDHAGLVCERSRDVTGVEMAGAAKNAAALAAAAAEPHGLNAAGIAVAAIWRECIDHAVARGAEQETFAGLAGVGDLTATMMAPSGATAAPASCSAPAPRPPRSPARSARPPRVSTPFLFWPRRRLLRSRGRRAHGLAALIRGDRNAEAVDGAPARGRARAAGRLMGAGVRLPVSGPEQNVEPAALAPAAKAELDRAFEDFYRAHLRDVYSYAYYRIGNHHDAEDLTEQAFLQAYRHFDRARRESDGRPLRPWVIRIAHNLASNYYRDRSRRPQTPLENADPIATRHDTEAIAEGREELRQVISTSRAARRPARGADHALRPGHGQPRDRAGAGALGRRDQGADPPRDQTAAGGNGR